MNNTESDNPSIRQEIKFIPKGSIAFFILLILLCLAIWYGIYYIMNTRS